MNADLKIRDELSKPVIFVGMMGCGKSYVSRLLAKRCGLDHYEMDDMIEAAEGMSIPQIFDKHGEERFRRLEAALLMDLLKNKGSCVISSGGGIVEKKENMDAILKDSISIWLKADVPVLLERVRGGEGRPMLLEGDNPAEALERLLNVRESLYSKAGIHITNNGDVDSEVLMEQIAEAIAGQMD